LIQYKHAHNQIRTVVHATQCPTDEEIELVRSFIAGSGVASDQAAALAGLGRAEQFVGALLSVSALKARLGAVRFKAQFPGRLAALTESCTALSSGCSVVMACPHLRGVMRLARDAGNVLNAGSFRGEAVAVDISFLALLSSVRVTGGGGGGAASTLLGCICEHLNKTTPGRAQAAAESLAPSAAAALVDLHEMRKTVSELEEGLQSMAKLLSAEGASGAGTTEAAVAVCSEEAGVISAQQEAANFVAQAQGMLMAAGETEQSTLKLAQELAGYD
jgi:hypothetical protein